MFSLQEVVPWGRSFAEYRRMFALSHQDLALRVFGCADGPASFNAELTEMGGRVVSGDPVYRFTAEDLRTRIDETHATIVEQTRLNAHEFVWDEAIPDIESLGRTRMAAMNRFLADYETGKAASRYVDCELPALPFEDDAFDLALCSHFLFLYSEQLSLDFHLRSICELCRVSGEARVFPLLELGSKPSRHVPAVVSRLRDDGYAVRIETVAYEFQKGGNQMLTVKQSRER